MLNLANSEKAFRKGEMYDLMWLNYDNRDLDCRYHYAWFRHVGNEFILCIVNFGTKDATIKLHIGDHAKGCVNWPKGETHDWLDLLTQELLTLQMDSEQKITLVLPAFGGRLLELAVRKGYSRRACSILL